MDSKAFTFQTRVWSELEQSNCLAAKSSLYNQIEHRLLAAFNRGESLHKLKNESWRKYHITSRQYNYIRIGLEGKIKSIQVLRDEHIADVKAKIKKVTSSIKYYTGLKEKEKTKKYNLFLHQRKRRLTSLQHKHDKLIKIKQSGKVSLCFGTNKLFSKQHNLAANNYASHEEWNTDWQNKRCSSFVLVGSKDELMGNQSCVASIAADNTISLRIRVPDALAGTYGKYLILNNISFDYGHNEVIEAIHENMQRNALSKKANRAQFGDAFRERGQPITYRFVKDDKGWRIMVTIMRTIKPTTKAKHGVIGVDINVDHLAISEINASGNYVKAFNIPLVTYGKSAEQRKAIIGDAVKTLVDHASKCQKTIVIEKLDFSAKKKELSNKSARTARRLSSFSYSQIITAIEARTFRKGVQVVSVNPVHSSVIGRVKFGQIYSQLSLHQAAALVIARRYLGFSESFPHRWNNIPLGNGDRGTLVGLAKILHGHERCTWGNIGKVLQEVHAARYQKFRQAAGPPGRDRCRDNPTNLVRIA